MKKFIPSKKAIIIVALILSISVWYVAKKTHKTEQPAAEPTTVEAQAVKEGDIPISEHAVGTLVASKNVVLTPEVAGQVAKILVKDGVFVKEGTPLIQLDDVVYKAKAESAKANLTYSETNYGRMVVLGKRGAISQQAIDQALADLKEKRAIENESRALADKMLISAPFDGILGKVKVNPGEHVAVGQQLAALTDTQNLRVEFNVSEKLLRYLKIGQQVTLKTTAYPEKDFYGKVSYIAPTINTEDRTISIYADVPNQSGELTAGLFVNVTQLLGNESHALLIPAVSLVATIDGQQVYKVVQGKAVAVPVKIGQRTIDSVQIVEGLALTDIVVTSGQHKLKDGSPVKLKS